MKVTYEEAVSAIRDKAIFLGAEAVPLAQARGRTLAQTVYAPVNQPPYDLAPFDGFALRAIDVMDASPAHPVMLEIMEEVPAGKVPIRPVQVGKAVKVMSGAMIPSGADCILAQGNATEKNGYLSVIGSMRIMEQIRLCGAEYQKGTPLLPEGSRLNAVAMGILASAGIKEVIVMRRPSVCIISAGDELQLPQFGPLSTGKVFASSGPVLKAALEESGISFCDYQKLRDDPGALSEFIFISAERYDLVITTGGLSDGDQDHIPPVLRKCGATEVIHGIEGQTGASVMFSTLYRTPILSLPGSPQSAVMYFDLLGRVLLAAMTGEDGFLLGKATASYCGTNGSCYPSERFCYGWAEDGIVLRIKKKDSGLTSLLDCNCIVDFGAQGRPLRAGAEVALQLLKHEVK